MESAGSESEKCVFSLSVLSKTIAIQNQQTNKHKH